MKKPRTAVSDHAVIRHLERVQGLPVETLRQQIGRRVDAALSRCGHLGGANRVVIDGFVYRIDPDSGVVVTIFESGPRARGRSRKRNKA